MSVLIKGMEMPKEGRITIQIGADGAVYTVSSCKITAEKYEEKYPAIEFHETHGRLIDADAVILEDGPYEYDEWCEWALRQYQAAPTVIPASPESEGG